jgi:hypothetical protein
LAARHCLKVRAVVAVEQLAALVVQALVELAQLAPVPVEQQQQIRQVAAVEEVAALVLVEAVGVELFTLGGKHNYGTFCTN